MPPGHVDPSRQPQVALEAKMLIERTAFVGHSFSEGDAEVIGFFKAVLTEMGVRCISGESAEAKSVSEKVKERVKKAELFVGVFTRREKLEGKDEWNTGSWVLDEKALAEALGKKLILLKEAGVGQIGGMQGDYEYIEFDRAALHKSAIRLMQTIWSLNPAKMTLNRHGPTLSPEVLQAAIAANPQEPSLRVALASHQMTTGRLDAAQRELQEVLSVHADYVPARLALSRTFRQLGSIGEAHKEVDRVLQSDPYASDAYHEKAH